MQIIAWQRIFKVIGFGNSKCKSFDEGGFKGIKLHPDFQKFNVDDEIAEKFYKLASNKLPILLHMGDDRYEYSIPAKLVNI